MSANFKSANVKCDTNATARKVSVTCNKNGQIEQSTEVCLTQHLLNSTV
jgi:imidazoleglycerol phosphate dehydratase HisB